MAKETNTPGNPNRPKRRGLKIAGLTLGVLLALMVVLYFVATSAGFLKGVILPRVSDSMNADVTVSDASISPFSQVVLQNLKVQPRGETEPLLTATEVRARYSLMQILRGNMLVQEVTITKPTIQLINQPDGTSNLDKITRSEDEESDDLQIDIRRVQVKDGTLRQITRHDATHQDTIELLNLNVDISNLKNNQTGKLEAGADILMTQNRPAPETNGTLQATFNSAFDIGLGKDLKPTLIQGSSRATVTRAEAGFAAVGKAAAELDVDITASEIRKVTMRLVRDNQQVAQIQAAGPFNMETLEGMISLNLEPLDKRSLNLFGAAAGLDFGTTSISSTNLIQIAPGAERIGLRGTFEAAKFQVVRTNNTTPALDLNADYDLEVNQAGESALLRKLDLTGRQNNELFLSGHLSSPMNFGWSTNAQSIGDSDLNIVLTNFNLANWKALIGDTMPTGVANAMVRLRSTRGGAELAYTVDSRLENFSLVMETNRVEQLAMGLKMNGQALNTTNHSLSQLTFDLMHQGRPALQATGTGKLNSGPMEGAFQLSGTGSLPALIQVMPSPGTELNSGELRFGVELATTQSMSQVTGQAVITNLTGTLGSNRFNAYWLRSELALRMEGDRLDINKAEGRLGAGTNDGGGFNLAGQYNLSNATGRVEGRLAGLNQHGLRPFLTTAFGDKKLETILVTGDFNAQMNSASNQVFTAQMGVTNLVVRDPAGKIPATPLGMGARLEATVNNDVMELKNTSLQLTPTERAQNVITLGARIDYSNTNAMRGEVDLQAEALDFTRYYDLFETAGNQTTPTAGGGTTTPGTSGSNPATGPETEPEPIAIPVTNFVARAKIGQFYLRELQLTNLQATVSIDGGRLKIAPARMSVNGAPVELALAADVSVPGYRYETRFSALQVPFAPLVNTFVPERKGQLGGTLTTTGYISGAGITGPNLKKNLAGNFDIGTTNLNLAIANVKSRLLQTIVNVIAIIPDLRKNPNAALGTLTSSLFGGATSERANNYMDELKQSPIDVIESRGVIAGGRVSLDRAFVQSRAFQANASGTIGLADVLTNSTIQIPLQVALERSLAERIEFVPAGTPTNQTYVALPDYVTIKGTIGEPKTDINKMALLGTALEQLGGKIPGVDQKTGSLIQGLGGILSGRRPVATDTNTPSTTSTNRSAATNAPPVSTNAPAAPATNQNPVGNLLDQLLGPGRK